MCRGTGYFQPCGAGHDESTVLDGSEFDADFASDHAGSRIGDVDETLESSVPGMKRI